MTSEDAGDLGAFLEEDGGNLGDFLSYEEEEEQQQPAPISSDLSFLESSSVGSKNDLDFLCQLLGPLSIGTNSQQQQRIKEIGETVSKGQMSITFRKLPMTNRLAQQTLLKY